MHKYRRFFNFIIPTSKEKQTSFLVILMLLFIFLVLAGMRINQPLAQDELFWYVGVKTAIETGNPLFFYDYSKVYFHHPYLHMWLMKPCMLYISYSKEGARVPGIILNLMAISLMFFSLRKFTVNKKSLLIPILGTLYFLLLPCIIQSSVIIEVDTAILIFTILGQCLFFVLYQKYKYTSYLVFIAFFTCLGFLGRISTPLISFIVLIVLQLITPIHLKDKIKGLLSLILGLVLFIFIWGGYCLVFKYDFWGPIQYTLNSFSSRTSGSLFSVNIIKKCAVNFLQFTLWTGVAFWLIFISALFIRLKLFLTSRRYLYCDTFLILGAFLLFGYFIVGGSVFGFIKYQIPALSLIIIWSFILLGNNIQLQKIGSPSMIFILVILGFIYQFFIIGDLLYVYRFTLRNTIAQFNSISPILLEITIKLLVTLMILILIFVYFRKILTLQKTLYSFIIFAIGCNFAHSLIQSSSNYQTGYDYGMRGVAQTIDFVKSHIDKNDLVIAPSEIYYLLPQENILKLKDEEWTSEDKLHTLLLNPRTKMFIINITTNPIGHIQFIDTNKTIRGVLINNYQNMHIGNYSIWQKKGE